MKLYYALLCFFEAIFFVKFPMYHKIIVQQHSLYSREHHYAGYKQWVCSWWCEQSTRIGRHWQSLCLYLIGQQILLLLLLDVDDDAAPDDDDDTDAAGDNNGKCLRIAHKASKKQVS